MKILGGCGHAAIAEGGRASGSIGTTRTGACIGSTAGGLLSPSRRDAARGGGPSFGRPSSGRSASRYRSAACGDAAGRGDAADCV